MKTRTFRSIINAVTWMLVGMVLMARYLCISMDITSGSHYVGWDTVAYILGGLAGLHLLMWFDPSFREPTWDQEHAEDHYDAYGVNTKNSFNTPPKEQ